MQNYGALLMGGNSGDMISIIWLVAFFGFLYFVFLRPQRKQKEDLAKRMASLEVGDSIKNTAGMIGVVIDIDDEDNIVIVEFGNNRNCRIPMMKDAIVEVEKPEDAVKPVEVKESKRSKGFKKDKAIEDKASSENAEEGEKN